jgi:hypothetical protein
LKTYDIMRKEDFVYTGLRGHKNIIYWECYKPWEIKKLDEDVFR